jgi:hypothetical protein
MAYASSKCFRATAVKTNSRATFQASGGNAMFFWGAAAGATGFPVAALGSGFAVFEYRTPRKTITPTTSTAPEIHGNHLLNFRDEIADWTTFTAI